jgi:hypothetical protein
MKSSAVAQDNFFVQNNRKPHKYGVFCYNYLLKLY